jgi:hypothetical protein
VVAAIGLLELAFRILGLGDSYLVGQGVRRQDICLSKLEVLLQLSGLE